MKDFIVTHELIFKKDSTYTLEEFLNVISSYESVEFFDFVKTDTDEFNVRVLGTLHLYGYKLDENPYYEFYDPIHNKLYSKEDLNDALYVEYKTLEECKKLVRN